MRFLSVLAISSVFALGAQADVLYDNITGVISGSPVPIASNGPLYDSFSTGTVAEELATVSVLLAGNPNIDPTVNVVLYSDSSNSPDLSTATNVGQINYSQAQDYTVTAPANTLLAANTRYWIALSTTDNAPSWVMALDASGFSIAGGPGVSQEFNAGGSPLSVSQNSLASPPFQMIVTGTPVPETSAFLPFTGMWLLFVAVGLGSRRRHAAYE